MTTRPALRGSASANPAPPQNLAGTSANAPLNLCNLTIDAQRYSAVNQVVYTDNGRNYGNPSELRLVTSVMRTPMLTQEMKDDLNGCVKKICDLVKNTPQSFHNHAMIAPKFLVKFTQQATNNTVQFCDSKNPQIGELRNIISTLMIIAPPYGFRYKSGDAQSTDNQAGIQKSIENFISPSESGFLDLTKLIHLTQFAHCYSFQDCDQITGEIFERQTQNTADLPLGFLTAQSHLEKMLATWCIRLATHNNIQVNLPALINRGIA